MGETKQQIEIALALRAALDDPVAGLQFIDRVLGEHLAAWIGPMSDVEADFLSSLLGLEGSASQRRQALEQPVVLSPAEVRAAAAILEDFAKRRQAGLIPMDRHQRRQREGWWGFGHCLRAFAKVSGLPLPDVYHCLNAYPEQVARDLLARHGWDPSDPSTVGLPLASWAPRDRKAMVDVLARAKADNTPPPAADRRRMN